MGLKKKATDEFEFRLREERGASIPTRIVAAGLLGQAFSLSYDAHDGGRDLVGLHHLRQRYFTLDDSLIADRRQYVEAEFGEAFRHPTSERGRMGHQQTSQHIPLKAGLLDGVGHARLAPAGHSDPFPLCVDADGAGDALALDHDEPARVENQVVNLRHLTVNIDQPKVVEHRDFREVAECPAQVEGKLPFGLDACLGGGVGWSRMLRGIPFLGDHVAIVRPVNGEEPSAGARGQGGSSA